MTDALQYASLVGSAQVKVPVQGVLNIGTKPIKELRFMPRSQFPEEGIRNILYIDTTANGMYYWDGTAYIALSGGESSDSVIAHTTAQWAEHGSEVSKYGVIYIYTDYRQEDEVNIPAVKVGDGSTYIADLPFFSTGVTPSDRERWDNKVSAKISPLDPENLILSTD